MLVFSDQKQHFQKYIGKKYSNNPGISRRCFWASNSAAFPIRCTRFTSKGSLVREIPVHQLNPGWWNVDIWPDISLRYVVAKSYHWSVTSGAWHPHIGKLSRESLWRPLPVSYLLTYKLPWATKSGISQQDRKCSMFNVQMEGYNSPTRGNHTSAPLPWAYGPTCRH